MQRGKFRRAERGRLRHEMFAEQIFVLDHRALERLKNDAGFAQRFRKDSRSSKLIVGENQARRDFHRAPRDRSRISARSSSDSCVAESIRREIERDRRWRNARPDLCASASASVENSRPGLPLLIAETKPGNSASAAARGRGRIRLPGDCCHFFEDSRWRCSYLRRERRSRPPLQCVSLGRKLSRPSLPSQARSGA